MKGIYKKYFEVPQSGVVDEKVVLSRGIMTLISILLILGVLTVTTYAYFGISVTSPSIFVTAANFQVELSLSETDNQKTRQLLSGKIATTYAVPLQAGKTYTITLKPAGNAQGGFCTLRATDCEETYYTQQLGADAAVSGGVTKKIQFTVIPTGDTVLTIDASWGTSSFYGQIAQSDERYVFGGESVVMTIAGAPMPVTEEEEATEPTVPETQPEATQQTLPTEPEATQPEATQPETPQTTEPQTTPPETEETE